MSSEQRAEEYGAFCMEDVAHPLSQSEQWGYGPTHPCLRTATVFHPAGQWCDSHVPSFAEDL